jgi:hypothetical protein
VAGVWQIDDERKNKYLVLRRDKTMPTWPWFVLAASDPAAPCALRAYADRAGELGMDRQYVSDLYRLADKFSDYRAAHADGDPDAAPHRTDDPATVAQIESKAP